eukprot:6878517-Prymnesium_polylepis.1
MRRFHSQAAVSSPGSGAPRGLWEPSVPASRLALRPPRQKCERGRRILGGRAAAVCGIGGGACRPTAARVATPSLAAALVRRGSNHALPPVSSVGVHRRTSGLAIARGGESSHALRPVSNHI